MQRKIILSLILIVVLIGMGTGVSYFLVNTKAAPPRARTVRPPLLVESVEVHRQRIQESIAGYGTARADRYARIAAQVSGEIVELADDLKPGTCFTKGQLLLRIDERDYREQLNQTEGLLAAAKAQLNQLDVEERTIDLLIESARAEFESATWELQRIKRLYDQNVGVKAEYEAGKRLLERSKRELQELENRKAVLPTQRAQLAATCRNHQATVALAQLNLERCRIVAPFYGQVDQLMVEIAERIMPGTQLLSILDPNLIEVPIELPVSVRERIEVGARCALSVDSMNGTTWVGRIKRISPSANELTRTFKLYVEVNNSEQPARLMPGYFVRAKIDGPMLEGVLLVPRGSIQDGQVFVHENGTAQLRKIQVVRHLLDQSIITGLEPGDIVITSNLDALSKNAPVRLDRATSAPALLTASTAQLRTLADKK